MFLPHIGKPQLLPAARFDYSGPLTETVLLGVVASCFPQRLGGSRVLLRMRLALS